MTSGPAGGRPPDPFADPAVVALLDVIAERGYEATDVAAVARRAGVSGAEFDARFADKEDCVDQVHAALVADFLWHVRRAYDAEEEWRPALRAAGYAAADWMNAHPGAARFGGLEVLRARSEAVRLRREEVFIYCASLIGRGREAAPDPAAVPETAPMMAIGAIAMILTRRMQRGEDLETDRMVPEMMYQAVRPYLGEEIAREELVMAPPARAPEP